jgi:hypothetical protein
LMRIKANVMIGNRLAFMFSCPIGISIPVFLFAYIYKCI